MYGQEVGRGKRGEERKTEKSEMKRKLGEKYRRGLFSVCLMASCHTRHWRGASDSPAMSETLHDSIPASITPTCPQI